MANAPCRFVSPYKLLQRHKFGPRMAPIIGNRESDRNQNFKHRNHVSNSGRQTSPSRTPVAPYESHMFLTLDFSVTAFSAALRQSRDTSTLL